MARFIKPLKRYGFTLVELLIVVAIIGVLSTIGVPTFNRMIQKAKKSEAKVSLSGLYTAESAFFSEHNVYGNHLARVGFRTEGTDFRYVVGFPAGACAGIAIAPPVGAPKTNGTVALAKNYADYALGFGGTVTLAVSTVAGTSTTVQGNTFLGACAASGFTNTKGIAVNGTSLLEPPGGGGKAVVDAAEIVDVYSSGISVSGALGDFDAFLATASGAIAPSVNPAGAKAADLDVWAINHQRNLINFQDGVR